MKKHIIFLTLLLSLILNTNIRGQELVKSKDDSLDIFLERKDFISYFRIVTELSDTASRHSNAESLLALSNLLQKDFGEMNTSQRITLRVTATKLGQKIYRLTGNVDESLRLYLVANENVTNKITLDSLAWYIENQIMNLYTMKGEYDKAKYFGNLIEASLKHYTKYEFLSRYYVNLGIILNSEFNIDGAIKTFEKGYKLADSIEYNAGVFANGLNLAGIYNEYPDLGSAEPFLVKSGELLPTLVSDNRYLEKKASFQIESADYKSLHGKYSESIPLYHDAIQTLNQYYPNTGRREFAKYYTSLATAYYKSDSLENAEFNVNLGLRSLIPEFKGGDAVPTYDQVYAENSIRDLLALKAQVYEKKFTNSGDYLILLKALECIERALDVNDMIRETVIADPSKLISIKSNKDLIEKGITILFQLFTQGNSTDYFNTARSLFNRSKSLLYNDKTRRNNLVEIFSGQDREKWIALQDTLTNLHEAKFNKEADINLINGQILTCLEQVDKLFSNYSINALSTYEPDQYVEYFMAKDYIYSLSKLSGENKFLKLGLVSEFQNLDDRLNSFISQKAMSLDNDILKDMYNFLIKPLAIQLPDQVVIIPDGSIGYVPFEMLQDGQGNYLLEESTISYSFEYTTLLNKGERGNKEINIFCLAPQYKAKEVKAIEVTRGSIYNLPYAKMEIDSIKVLFGNSAMTSQSGDKNDLDMNLRQTNIFHYAGHAIIKNDKAYLALNDSGDEKQQLTGSEIGLRRHLLDLVVLSACETGLGKMEQGEGIRSLGRSFMESGAKSTVISLWNVNDKSTAVIMTLFYKNLIKGMRKDAALRKAKLDFITTAQSGFRHPYYWAAFIPAGDMNPIENN